MIFPIRCQSCYNLIGHLKQTVTEIRQNGQDIFHYRDLLKKHNRGEELMDCCMCTIGYHSDLSDTMMLYAETKYEPISTEIPAEDAKKILEMQQKLEKEKLKKLKATKLN